MTKEEILDPFRKMSDSSTSWVYEEDAIKAMDEYAKQQAIAFMNWTLSSDCDTYSCTDENQWTNIFTSENITTEQLYNQFIDQQNKQ